MDTVDDLPEVIPRVFGDNARTRLRTGRCGGTVRFGRRCHTAAGSVHGEHPEQIVQGLRGDRAGKRQSLALRDRTHFPLGKLVELHPPGR